MDFKALYADKQMTAAQAAALVQSGDWVDYGWTANTPVGWMQPWPSACPSWKGSISMAAS